MIIRLIGILAPVISYFSEWITMRIDESTEATVGVTRFKGFPVWFYEQASGISIMSGWHLERFIWNTTAWFTFLIVIIWATALSQKSHRR